MSATVKIVRLTGSSPTETDLNPSGPTGINTRASASDVHSTSSLDDPIQIPDSGTSYSYWVTLRLKCTVSPAGTINNIRWYTDGSNNFGTGVSMKCAKASTGANSGYRQATGIPGTGLELNQSNHTGLDESPSNAFAFTALSPKSLNGSISNPNVGQFGDLLVYQLEIDQTASPGPTAGEWLYMKYDET